MRVLVTGGAGYIGSTVVYNLLAKGYQVVVIDSLSKGQRSNLPPDVPFFHGHVGDLSVFADIAKTVGAIDTVIHCASHISVPESQSEPRRYLRNNVAEFVLMLEGLELVSCSRLIFSSSASIYGGGDGEVNEESSIDPRSVYAETKWLCEQISASAASCSDLRVLNLRYFNPIGTDPQGRCGPGNVNDGSLLNELTKAVIRGTSFRLTGSNWSTRDGTGVRDYVDVNDLAKAHVLACEKFDAAVETFGRPSIAINLGTGSGVTVKEMISAAEQALGHSLAVEIMPRRPGDVAGSYANISRANDILGWKPAVSLDVSIRSHVDWWRARIK